MNRLNKEGHTAHINVIDVELPDHLKDVPKDKLETLVEIFKPRL